MKISLILISLLYLCLIVYFSRMIYAKARIYLIKELSEIMVIFKERCDSYYYILLWICSIHLISNTVLVTMRAMFNFKKTLKREIWKAFTEEREFSSFKKCIPSFQFNSFSLQLFQCLRCTARHSFDSKLKTLGFWLWLSSGWSSHKYTFCAATKAANTQPTWSSSAYSLSARPTSWALSAVLLLEPTANK